MTYEINLKNVLLYLRTYYYDRIWPDDGKYQIASADSEVIVVTLYDRLAATFGKEAFQETMSRLLEPWSPRPVKGEYVRAVFPSKIAGLLRNHHDVDTLWLPIWRMIGDEEFVEVPRLMVDEDGSCCAVFEDFAPDGGNDACLDKEFRSMADAEKWAAKQVEKGVWKPATNSRVW
jgi:hypothetical protein